MKTNINTNPGLPEVQVQPFQKALLNWYNAAKRPMPWRENPLPYEVWVSEVMLQQTQVATVIPYFQRFITAFPTIAALAAADTQQVLKLWEGLGYYSRARNLQKAAQAVVSEHGGKIPSDYAVFIKLPGVGPYIAAAVTSIAFGKPHAVVDGNVKRVLARLLGIELPVNDSKALDTFQSAADKLLEKDIPGDYNQAMMELGAVICKPQAPLCQSCPVQRFCHAFATHRQADLPRRKQRPQTPEYDWVIAIVTHEGRWLLLRRPEDGLLGGLWEFPTGAVKAGESGSIAAKQIVRDVCGLSVQSAQYLGMVKHAFTHFKIRCQVYFCRSNSNSLRFPEPRDYQWVDRTTLGNYPLPKTHHKLLKLLDDRQTRLHF